MPVSKAEYQAYFRLAVWLEFVSFSFLLFGYAVNRAVFSLFYIGLPEFFSYEPKMVFQLFGVPYWLPALLILLALNFLLIRKDKGILLRFVSDPWSHLFPGRRLVLANLASFLLLVALFFVLEVFL